MDKYSVVSLFSGVGGLDLGFKNTGFEIIFANDVNKDAVNTYRNNIGNNIICEDICNVQSDSIPDNPDVVIGGFPCQGFSVANKNRSMKDERNFLYKELLRVIRDKRPKFFVAENVKGLLSMENGKVIKMIISDFENLGYKVDYKLLNFAEYGIPQLRERVIIIGNRLGVDNIYPEKTHSVNGSITLLPAVTVKQSIGFLSNIDLNENMINFENRMIFNHIGYTNVNDKFLKRKYVVNQSEICDYLRKWRMKKGISVKDINDSFGYKHTANHWFRKDKYGTIPNSNDWLKLKKLLEFDNTYDDVILTLVEKEITFDQSLRITNWEKPSATITASTSPIHINKKRRLSVRECAILQSFPDDFIFTGSLFSMYQQIGNAVSPLISEKIAQCIKKSLDFYKNKINM